jgi:C-terminal processing protease CtpA/Prc
MMVKTVAFLFLAGTAAAPLSTPTPVAVPARAIGLAPERIDPLVERDEARNTVLDLAQKLQDDYVLPEVALQYAEMLRANVNRGVYDEVSSARAFAQRLTADLLAVSPDNHLRVSVGSASPPESGRPSETRAATTLKPIDDARWLAPGIAYIRFNVFPGDAGTVAAVRAFMTGHARARVVIFDNRTHRGGGLAEMDAIFPYLFAKPTSLVTMDTRASVDRARGSPIAEARVRTVPAKEDVVRREHYVEPSPSERRLFNAKVFVLTSGATASAAEHMTLALKRTHRATIIGEPTAGAGNFGGLEQIGARFTVFIPVGRTFDPDTGKGWEGAGIGPDVAVPAERALTEALVRSGLSESQASRITADVKPTSPMTRRNPRPN